MANAAGVGFTGGGISPQEAVLTQYNFGERALKGAGTFGNSGLGMSTNETLGGAVGPTIGAAEQASLISDQLAAAQGEFANAQQLGSKTLTSQGLGNVAGLLGKGGA
jgi:hypothetical protein